MIAELRRIHRGHVSRLRALSVDVRELSPADAKDALARFARDFLGAERAPTFLAAVDSAKRSGREINYPAWLGQGFPLPTLSPRFGWLADWHPHTFCIRFDRRPAIPTVRLPVSRMLDQWALSWPGVYVSFEQSRALLVSHDLELLCYDLAVRARSPYR